MKPFHGTLAVVLIIAAGSFFRLDGIERATISDDASYLYKSLLVYQGQRPYEDFFCAHPPLYLYLSALSYRMFGVGIVQGKLFEVLFSIAALPLTYFVTKRFYGLQAALFTTLMFSLSYGTIVLTKHIYLSSIPLFFSLLASYLFLEGSSSGRRAMLVLAGASAGIAILCKLTGIIVLASIAVYALLSREPPKNVLCVAGGFLLVIVPSLAPFLSKSFLWQVLGFHAGKHGFSILSRAELGLIVTFGMFPAIFSFGLWGIYKVLASGPRCKADTFYAINAAMSLCFIVLIQYNITVLPAVYISASIYAFAILGNSILKGTDSIFAIFAVLLLVSTIAVACVRLMTCDAIASRMLTEDTMLAAEFMAKRSTPADMVVAVPYEAYYVPFLSGRRIVPELVDLNINRLGELDRDSLLSIKSGAGYMVFYSTPNPDGDELLTILGIRRDDWLIKANDRMNKMLLSGAREVGRFGSIVIYENAVGDDGDES